MRSKKYFHFTTSNAFYKITRESRWINGSFILGGLGRAGNTLTDNVIEMADDLRVHQISVSVKPC